MWAARYFECSADEKKQLFSDVLHVLAQMEMGEEKGYGKAHMAAKQI